MTEPTQGLRLGYDASEDTVYLTTEYHETKMMSLSLSHAPCEVDVAYINRLIEEDEARRQLSPKGAT